MLEYAQRLMLRLGRDAPLVRLYAAAGEACGDGWRLLTDAELVGPSALYRSGHS